MDGVVALLLGPFTLCQGIKGAQRHGPFLGLAGLGLPGQHLQHLEIFQCGEGFFFHGHFRGRGRGGFIVVHSIVPLA